MDDDYETKGTFKKSKFVEHHVYMFVLTFDNHGSTFLFDDMDMIEAIMCYFWRSEIKPNVKLVSSKNDMGRVFDEASYADLTRINDINYIIDVACNRLHAKLDDLGDPVLFLKTMRLMPRSSLNAVHDRRLKQITAWFNKDDDSK